MLIRIWQLLLLCPSTVQWISVIQNMTDEATYMNEINPTAVAWTKTSFHCSLCLLSLKFMVACQQLSLVSFPFSYVSSWSCYVPQVCCFSKPPLSWLPADCFLWCGCPLSKIKLPPSQQCHSHCFPPACCLSISFLKNQIHYQMVP